ncbi:hypothetical protein Lfu02_80070 [Longispora fulva]|uniref:Capsid maturation protease n=1 Tax=Longispora fulva TaxID=619741 RepID=A0A8J7GNY6_9ACTN|nr:hypothetical protein [Longispora fulva]MBG6140677.1 hypothetical protein [Longispora fulva]GIG63635.1 hypothetical protein Lfu02_80070 [Longispora fulva]
MAARLADRTALTEQHRRAQLGVRARFAAEFLDLWPVLDPFRIAATAPRWLRLAVPLVHTHRARSAELSTRYVGEYRRLALPRALGPAPVPAPVPVSSDAVRTSLLVTGPATIRRRTRDGLTVAEAARVASVRAVGAASRHVLDGGRDLVRETVKADRLALGWARVSDGSPCAFCAMLLSRGPVYKSAHGATVAEDGEAYHDGCACQVVPVYSLDDPWPGNGREYEKLWQDVAAGSRDPLNAFRQALKDRNTAGPAPEPGEQLVDATAPEPDREPADTEPDAPATGQLDDAALTELDDDALADEFARWSSTAEPDEAYLERVLTEMDRREADPEPDPDPLDGVPLDELLDSELVDLYDEHAGNPAVVARIEAELAHRDADREAGDPWLDYDHHDPEQHLDALLAKGWDYKDAYAEAYNLDPADLDRQERAAAVDAQRITGETREQTVRRLYDEWVALQYIEAENHTRGHLLSRAGEAAGIDPLSLFSGTTARARKYASEDLQRFWAEQAPRQTLTEFRAALLNRDADVVAAARTRMQGNGRDFL